MDVSVGPLRKVLIVESPSLDDIDHGDGTGRILEQQLRLLRIPVVLAHATSHERLVRVIEDHAPFDVLHLSVHGDFDGVGFTDGSLVPWRDLHHIAATASRRILILDACSSARFAPNASHHDEELAAELSKLPPGPRFVLTFMSDVYFADTALAWGLFYTYIAKNSRNVPVEELDARIVFDALERVRVAQVVPKICAWHSTGGRYRSISPWEKAFREDVRKLLGVFSK